LAACKPTAGEVRHPDGETDAMDFNECVTTHDDRLDRAVVCTKLRKFSSPATDTVRKLINIL
jgi:hypothetical protein